MTAHSNGTIESLDRLYDDYWEFGLRENPTGATYLGDHRYDDKLEDVSAEGYFRRVDQLQRYLGELKSLKRPSQGSGQLNFDLFKRELEMRIEGAKYRPYLLPITQQDGPHIDLPQLTTYHPFKTLQDYENYAKRLRQFPRVFDQIIQNLKAGITAKIVQPKDVVERIIPQLESQIVSTPADSELDKPVGQIPSTIVSHEAQLRRDIEEAIMGFVVPAYARLFKFVKEEYLPKARVEPGIWALSHGRSMYAYSIRYHTTTNLTPAQIHRIGKRELARIAKEIRVILRRARFKGSLQSYNDTLRNDKSNFYTSGRELLDGFRQILERMDAKLPLLFGRLPKVPYGFREIEEFRADAAPAAYYYLAPEDRSRPAYFYVNTFKPETRPKYTMEALAYHEAVPGHHLQLGLQQELEGLPKFRRHGGYTAFIEGWALYAERLGKEVGLYQDLLSDFGRLTQEAWRAARLVVDTGIHSMKWTRARAIKFLRENTATSEQDIASEVDRYIAWPGQALAYKIGELKIREIRGKAERIRRRRFGIRDFHDVLLDDGALPLDLLEKKMQKWISLVR